MKRYGRMPAQVRACAPARVSRTKVVLTFTATGSDGRKPPAARSYLVKQSRRPDARPARLPAGAGAVRGSCSFKTATAVGMTITLTITDLRPRTVYRFAVAARDNVSHLPRPALAGRSPSEPAELNEPRPRSAGQRVRSCA